MKRMALAILATLSMFAAAHATVTLETLTWLDNGLNYNTNFNYVSGGDFSITRAYFGVKGDIGKDWFGNNIYGRFTLDLSQAQFGSTSVVTSVGTNGKANSTTTSLLDIPVKYSYVDWTLFTLKDNDNKLFDIALSGGLMPTHFGNIAEWQYVMPVKDAEEVFGKTMDPTASADFGVALSGSALNSMIKYYAQELSGQSYKVILNDNQTNNNYEFLGQLQLLPLKGLEIAGSVKYFNNDNATGYNELGWNALVGIKNLTLGEGDSAMVIPVDFLFQVEGQNYHTTNTSAALTNASGAITNGGTSLVYSAMLGFNFFDYVTPYIRYDVGNANTTLTNTNANTTLQNLYVSLNITPNPNLSIRPMAEWEFSTFTNKTTFNQFYAKVELEYKVNFQIWQ